MIQFKSEHKSAYNNRPFSFLVLKRLEGEDSVVAISNMIQCREILGGMFLASKMNIGFSGMYGGYLLEEEDRLPIEEEMIIGLVLDEECSSNLFKNLKYLNKLESEAGLELSIIQETTCPNVYLVTGSKAWNYSIPLQSLYFLLLRVFSANKVSSNMRYKFETTIRKSLAGSTDGDLVRLKHIYNHIDPVWLIKNKEEVFKWILTGYNDAGWLEFLEEQVDGEILDIEDIRYIDSVNGYANSDYYACSGISSLVETIELLERSPYNTLFGERCANTAKNYLKLQGKTK